MSETGYDIVVLGHLSNDINVFQEHEERVAGGAVLYSAVAAARSGARVLAVARCAPADRGKLAVISDAGADLRVLESGQSTSIRNVYHTADRERRTVTLLSRADPFSPDDLPDEKTRIFHFAGLFAGEIPDALIKLAANRADVALDVQGVLRAEEGERLVFRDWPRKMQYLPHITYLKTDAAEAGIMTGTDDRADAARMLGKWGAREVMITHSSEVIVWSGSRLHRAPLTPRNLSGRTGRGDTCFAAYLARRLQDDVKTSVRFAAALVSLKMETPGVFAGSADDVYRRMRGTQ